MIDVTECRRTLEKRRATMRAQNLDLWRRAREEARRAIAHIVRHYHPVRVIQWGSVLDAERFGPHSDIDIAVEGDFEAETWFRLLGELWEMTEFPVDIVDLRRIEPEFADIIRMKGETVYDRDASADRGNP